MKKCNCISHNRPNRSGGTDVEVVMFPPFQNKSVCVDACIAKEIKMMWDAGYQTWGCCCGHNLNAPSVIVDKNQVESLECFTRDLTKNWVVFGKGNVNEIQKMLRQNEIH